MEKMFEIRWHGRGGQGAVTAARLLAELSVAKGRYAQAFPEFGPERRGAPVQAFTRLSTSAIRAYYGVTNPDAVIVLDSSLFKSVDVKRGMVSDGILLINSDISCGDIWKPLKAADEKIFMVEAHTIAMDCIGVPIPNTAMIGAMVKVADLMSLEETIEYFKKAFSSKFSSRVLEGNLKAIKRGYEEVKAQ